MEAGYLLLCTVLFLALSCCVIPLLSPQKKSAAGVVFVALNAGVTSILAGMALTGHPIELTLDAGEVFGAVNLRIDALSAWFVIIVNFTCVNGALYGIQYMKPYEVQNKNTSLHWPVFVALQTSMLWICSLQHGLAFLIAWEIMSLSAFLLLMFEHSRLSVLKAGLNYLIQAHIGATCLTIAFIWISTSVGSYDFVSIPVFFNTPDSRWVLWLFLIGFGMKAGFILLHTWMPHADPAAPSHVSGLMSGVLVTMGLFGILRMIGYLHKELIVAGEIILLISVSTAFYGILSAAIHRDIRRVLAFCTIENVGLAGMGIGVGLIGKGIGNTEVMFLGFSAALLHSLNHSLYKSLLFFVAGNIYHQAQTRNVERLGGLIKVIPVSSCFFLFGSIAVSGLPPFNGFVSKFLLYSSLIEAIKIESFQLNIILIGSIAGLALVGGISTLTFTKSFGTIFLGVPRSKYKRLARETLSLNHLPFLAALLPMLVFGLFPFLIMIPVQRVVCVISPDLVPPETLTTIKSTLSNVGISSVILILIAVTVYLAGKRTAAKTITGTSPTWNCGYAVPNSRMQYTGKSFSKTFAKLFAFITGEQKKFTEIERHDVFPAARSYQSSYPEFFEKNIINKASNQLLHFMNYFSVIHSGRIQMYVWYGFLFILISIMTTLFSAR
jgi:formate hydrogenlyase subunit 3/multisubunit Na+/H+ antiporter MnhD subunit